MAAVLQPWQIFVAALAGWPTDPLRTCNVFGPLEAERSASWRYNHSMDPATMNAILASIPREEIELADLLIFAVERSGTIDPDEANEWRRRIVAWRVFFGTDGRATELAVW